MARSLTTTTGPNLSSGRWAGDYTGRNSLLPGGAHLNAADAGFVADADGKKYIPSGTIIGRTRAERDAGTGFGPAADADEEFGIVMFDVDDALHLPDCDIYRPGAGLVVYSTFLPVWGTLSAAVQAAIRDRYNVQTLAPEV